MSLPTTIMILILLMVSSNAHAYMDPGTGSMLLQVILGGLAVWYFLFK